MAIQYTGLGGSDYGDMSLLSDQQLYDIMFYGANAATPEERAAIKAAAQAEQAARAGTYTPPTGNGMGAGGGQVGVTPIAPPTSVAPESPLVPTYTPPAQPAPQDPFVPTGPSTAPPTNGMGPDGGQLAPVDTGWDWDSMGQGPDYSPQDPGFAITQDYQPGRDSPWGNPDLPGGNQDFYAQQFGNLLAQDQDFQSRQRAAAESLRQSQNQPSQAPTDPWSWVNGGQGLPEIVINSKGYTPPREGFEFTKRGYGVPGNGSGLQLPPDAFYDENLGRWVTNGSWGAGQYPDGYNPTPGGGGGDQGNQLD